MQYSKEQIAQIKALGGPEAFFYIEDLEERLAQAEVDGAVAKAGEIVTDAANIMHGANLNDIFTQFCNLPHACNYTLELYWDGSGQIVNNVPVNTLCSWDDLSEAQAAIERAFSNNGKGNSHV